MDLVVVGWVEAISLDIRHQTSLCVTEASEKDTPYVSRNWFAGHEASALPALSTNPRNGRAAVRINFIQRPRKGTGLLEVWSPNHLAMEDSGEWGEWLFMNLPISKDLAYGLITGNVVKGNKFVVGE